MTPNTSVSFAVARLSRRWRKLLDQRLADLGLTQSRWTALVYLQRLGDNLTQRQLADALAIESPTLVRLLDGLEKAGLVRRHACAKDARAKRIRLTEPAEDYLLELNQRAAQLRAEVLTGISAEELAQFFRTLERMETNLDQLEAKADQSGEDCSDV